MKYSGTKTLAVARRVLAVFVLAAVTLIFLDFTGLFRSWLGWLAKIQFLPAVLAANFAVIAAILVVTILFGRVYCSVICPLGIFQDGVSRLSGKRQKGKKRLRFHWRKEHKWPRYVIWGVFIIALLAGLQWFVALLAPYSAYGRIVTNLFQPVYRGVNNLLAGLSARWNNYAFYPKEVWLKSLPTFIVAAVTFIALAVTAWLSGREYCNTVCPVGTTLSFFSRFAMFRPVIDEEKCKNCRLCERGCKSSCIDIANHKIDYSRCVDCFNCLGECKFDALHYRFAWGRGGDSSASLRMTGKKAQNDKGEARNDKRKSQNDKGVAQNDKREAQNGTGADAGRRAFITTGVMLAGALALDAQDKKLDGGFAPIIRKREPERSVRLVPPGAVSPDRFYSHCTACGLCIAACPNKVLRPSGDLEHLMMPYMSYESGYCRPECTKCSQVCPAGAILPISPEEKTQVQIGIASVNYDRCVVNADGVSCGNCSRHCPAGAITMVPKDPSDKDSPKIPTVDGTLCIGCGACENLCPASPLSAISVNGRHLHTDNR